MSSFWAVDGDDIRDSVDADKDLPSNDFDPIPNKTKVLALITEAGIAEKDGLQYAFATMEIVKPEAYARRKIFPRFWVYDENPKADDPAKKRKNDLTRFTKLDAACGGKLARKDGVPRDEDIAMAFTNKQVIVNVMLMEPKNGEPVQWYSDYWSKGSKEIVEPQPKTGGGGSGGSGSRNRSRDDDLDDSDVPF